MPNFKTLYKGGGIEIRKYPPCSRTLFYLTFCKLRSRWREEAIFVALPFQVYATVKNYCCNGFGPGKFFFAMFAKGDDEFIYPTPFGPACSPICVDSRWHYGVPENEDMSEAIKRYWATYFNIYGAKLPLNVLKVENFEDWAQLTIDQVLDRLDYAKRPIAEVIERLKFLRHTDDEIR